MRPTHFAAAATLTVLAAAAATAAPAFMRFEGVDVPDGHKEQLEVVSYNWGTGRVGGKMHMEDISAAPVSKDGAKGGNVEFEWKVEEGESAPPPRGGVRVAAGDVDGDGRSDGKLQELRSRAVADIDKAPAPTEKRQHDWRPTSKPAAKGTVWIRVATPWTACRVGARYPSLELNDGKTRYQLQEVMVSSCGRSGDADDRPTEEVAFYYNRIAFNYSAPRAR